MILKSGKIVGLGQMARIAGFRPQGEIGQTQNPHQLLATPHSGGIAAVVSQVVEAEGHRQGKAQK